MKEPGTICIRLAKTSDIRDREPHEHPDTCNEAELSNSSCPLPHAQVDVLSLLVARCNLRTLSGSPSPWRLKCCNFLRRLHVHHAHVRDFLRLRLKFLLSRISPFSFSVVVRVIQIDENVDEREQQADEQPNPTCG